MNYIPWKPDTDPVVIKTLGKLAEELGECSAAVARCLIQGIDEAEPMTGKTNRHWLEEEIADVYANTTLVIRHFRLDLECIGRRCDAKIPQLEAWHREAGKAVIVYCGRCRACRTTEVQGPCDECGFTQFTDSNGCAL